MSRAPPASGSQATSESGPRSWLRLRGRPARHRRLQACFRVDEELTGEHDRLPCFEPGQNYRLALRVRSYGDLRDIESPALACHDHDAALASHDHGFARDDELLAFALGREL